MGKKTKITALYERISRYNKFQGDSFSIIHQKVLLEEYLQVFLSNGDVPIDNSASERSIRSFTDAHKNWVLV